MVQVVAEQVLVPVEAVQGATAVAGIIMVTVAAILMSAEVMDMGVMLDVALGLADMEV